MRNDEDLFDRLDALENRIGTDAVEAIDDDVRKQIEAVAAPGKARRRLDADERKRFDRFEEQIAEDGVTDAKGHLTTTGKRYLDFLLRGYPQT